ncbi:TPA: hypothetical protein EYP26_00700 [Candidatus Bathyarchaeota archaeon]|nr:hypothetical protein [Candidatus Bathyarchaeota archaeon]
MGLKPAKYRSEIKILADILKVIKREARAKPTRILYKANLSYDRLNKYLERLKSAGLIQELENKSKSKYYILTQKGEEFLNEYRKFERFAEAFGFIL